MGYASAAAKDTRVARQHVGCRSSLHEKLHVKWLQQRNKDSSPRCSFPSVHPFAVPRVGTQPGGSKQCWCFVIIPPQAWRSHGIINQPKSSTRRLAERGASARIDASQPLPKIALYLTHAVILVLFVILHQHCCASGSDSVVLQGGISERSPGTCCG